MAGKEHVHHEIDYIEFEVTDMAESQRFYGAAFGWKFNDYGPGYAGIQKRGGGEAGGLQLAVPLQRPEWHRTRGMVGQGTMTPADFGDARLRGPEHRLAVGGPSSPSSKIQFRWALEDLYQRC